MYFKLQKLTDIPGERGVHLVQKFEAVWRRNPDVDVLRTISQVLTTETAEGPGRGIPLGGLDPEIQPLGRLRAYRRGRARPRVGHC